MTNTPAPELVETIMDRISEEPRRDGDLGLVYAHAQVERGLTAALSAIPPTPEISEDEAREQAIAAIEELIPWSPGTESRRGFPNPEEIWDAILPTLQQSSTRAPDRDGVLEEAAWLEFVRKAEAGEEKAEEGEARSEPSYAQMKAARALQSTRAPDRDGVLHDFQTHRDSWRQAIILARDFASEGSEDPSADRLYWNHELRAFDRAFAALKSTPAEQASDKLEGDAYSFADEIIHWMNSTDSSEMTVQQFRSALNMKLLEMSPRSSFPSSAGVCAYDRDECTVTLAVDSEAEVRTLLNLLPHRNRVALQSTPAEQASTTPEPAPAEYVDEFGDAMFIPNTNRRIINAGRATTASETMREAPTDALFADLFSARDAGKPITMGQIMAAAVMHNEIKRLQAVEAALSQSPPEQPREAK